MTMSSARRRVSVLLAIVALLLTLAPPAAASHSLARPAKGHGPLSPRLAMLADLQPTARALSLPERGPGSLVESPAGEILVYLQLETGEQPPLDALTAAGVHIVQYSPHYHSVTAFVSPRRLNALALLPGVLNLREALEPTRSEAAPYGYGAIQTAAQVAPGPCPAGERTAEADALLRAAEARSSFGVDGGGVTVGVLSGSFDVSRETEVRAANDVATGDLPGDGNPCGRTEPIRILAETRLGVGRDEGRAMLQIVHDIAPGARLAFATAGDGLYAFAENIRRLRAEAAADIIVDDYYYPEEPMFQDGPVSVAIRDVTADGAIYVTAGGNIHVEDRRRGSPRARDWLLRSAGLSSHRVPDPDRGGRPPARAGCGLP